MLYNHIKTILKISDINDKYLSVLISIKSEYNTLLFIMARMQSMQTWISSFASPIFKRATCLDLRFTLGLSLSSWRDGLKHPLFKCEEPPVSTSKLERKNFIIKFLIYKSMYIYIYKLYISRLIFYIYFFYFYYFFVYLSFRYTK